MSPPAAHRLATAEAGGIVIAGRYELGDALGRGGTATVYRAWDNTLEVERAIKLLTAAVSPTSTLGKRFLREARTMARLQHPHILMVADAGIQEDQPWMVMELLAGGSLRSVLDNEGPLELSAAVSVTLALLAALEHAHSQGIVHRDVKPGNILLDERGVAKLADFGLARVNTHNTHLTRTGATMGTFAYMAPEQRVDASRADLRADVFGAGCNLFALLTGQDPFDLCMAEPSDPRYRGVPEAVAQVIRTACSYKAEDRYPSAELFAMALTQAYNGAGTGFLPPLVLPNSPSLPPKSDETAGYGLSRAARIARSQEPEESEEPGGRTDPWTGERTGPMTWAFDDEDPEEGRPPISERLSSLNPFRQQPHMGAGMTRNSAHASALRDSLEGARRRLAQVAAPATAALMGALAVVAFGGSSPGLSTVEPPAADTVVTAAEAAQVTPPAEDTPPDAVPAVPTPEADAPEPALPELASAAAGPVATAPTPVARVAEKPAAAPAATASLRVGSLPFATVYVDGRKAGLTPYSGTATTGSRRVKLVLADGRSKTLSVQVSKARGGETCWDFEAGGYCS